MLIIEEHLPGLLEKKLKSQVNQSNFKNLMSHLVLIIEKHLPGLLEKQLKSQVNQSNFKNHMSHLV